LPHLPHDSSAARTGEADTSAVRNKAKIDFDTFVSFLQTHAFDAGEGDRVPEFARISGPRSWDERSGKS